MDYWTSDSLLSGWLKVGTALARVLQPYVIPTLLAALSWSFIFALTYVKRAVVHLSSMSWAEKRVEVKRWYWWIIGEGPLGQLRRSVRRPTTECEICLSRIHEEEKAEFPCTHTYCRTCIRRYIAEELDKGRVDIQCPSQDGSFMDTDVLWSLAWVDPVLVHNLERVTLEQGLLQLPNVFRCPAPNCSYACWLDKPIPSTDAFKNGLFRRLSSGSRFQMDSTGRTDMRKFQCPACSYSSCLCCRSLWSVWGVSHDALDCGEFSEKVPRDAATAEKFSENFIQRSKHIKPCPRCKSPIEKNEGCRHMTCAKCRHQFCWMCMRNWSVCKTSVTCLGRQPETTQCSIQ